MQRGFDDAVLVVSHCRFCNWLCFAVYWKASLLFAESSAPVPQLDYQLICKRQPEGLLGRPTGSLLGNLLEAASDPGSQTCCAQQHFCELHSLNGSVCMPSMPLHPFHSTAGHGPSTWLCHTIHHWQSKLKIANAITAVTSIVGVR